MTISSFLVQNMAELFTLNSVMTGGKVNMNTNIYQNKQKIILFSLFGYLIVLLLKGIIVYLLYNFMIPKLIYSFSENKSLEIIESNFKTISFSEAILLVILTNTLFGC